MDERLGAGPGRAGTGRGGGRELSCRGTSDDYRIRHIRGEKFPGHGTAAEGDHLLPASIVFPGRQCGPR